MRKSYSLVELIITILIIGIILSIAYVKYAKWSKRISIENDTKFIYSVINQKRMEAIANSKSFKIKTEDKRILIKDLSNNHTLSFPLHNTFSGAITIYSKGTMSSGSIILLENTDVSPSISCVTSNGIRLRMGKTEKNSKGKRYCK